MTDSVSLSSLAGQVAELRELLINAPRFHRKDVMARYSIGKSTLHRWVNQGRLPRPVRLGCPLWRLGDLQRAESQGLLPDPAN